MKNKVQTSFLIIILQVIALALYGCTILNWKIESNRSDEFSFDQLKSVLIYSDIGTRKGPNAGPRFASYLQRYFTEQLQQKSVNVVYYHERIQFNLESALDKAKHSGASHLLTIERIIRNHRLNFRVSLYNVETSKSLYKAFFKSGGMTRSSKTYAEDLVKTIVGHLEHPR